MEQAINNLKQHLHANVDMLRDNPEDEQPKKDILALIKAINVLEVHAYGHAITDEWGL